MTADDETVARELLGFARSLLERSTDDTQGLWPRAAVLSRVSRLRPRSRRTGARRRRDLKNARREPSSSAWMMQETIAWPVERTRYGPP